MVSSYAKRMWWKKAEEDRTPHDWLYAAAHELIEAAEEAEHQSERRIALIAARHCDGFR